jgi:hypothetical protein
VQVLTIKAVSAESAEGLYGALEEFQPVLEHEEDGGHFVSVQLGSDRRVLDVLDAIQSFLADRAAAVTSSAIVEFDGRSYVFEA